MKPRTPNLDSIHKYFICFAILPFICCPAPLYSQTPTQDILKQPEEYVPCRDGPQRLNQIDSLERDYGRAALKYESKPITAEAFAEILIRDCSGRLASLSAGALLPDIANDPWYHALTIQWQRNLDYMKWWLRNRYQKQNPAQR